MLCAQKVSPGVNLVLVQSRDYFVQKLIFAHISLQQWGAKCKYYDAKFKIIKNK